MLTMYNPELRPAVVLQRWILGGQYRSYILFYFHVSHLPLNESQNSIWEYAAAALSAGKITFVLVGDE